MKMAFGGLYQDKLIRSTTGDSMDMCFAPVRKGLVCMSRTVRGGST